MGTAIVSKLANNEKMEIRNAFLASSFRPYAQRILYLNWTSSMNSEYDLRTANGGKKVFIANDGSMTYLAEKNKNGYNVAIIDWK